MKKFEMTSLRLTELEAARRENLRDASGPSSPLWELAEDLETAIQTKLAEVNVKTFVGVLSRQELWVPWEPLEWGVPDSERIYGSGYLARHPEVQYVDVIAPGGTLWPEERP